MRKLGLLIRWWSVRWWLVGMVVIVLTVGFKFLTLAEGLQILIMYTLVLVTAQYATSTHKMAEEMKLTRKMQAMPSIIAYFDNPQSVLIDLVVKNIGYGAARDVSLKIDPPLLDHKERDIAELSLFKKGINFLPPNREFRQIVGTSKQFLGEGSQRPLEYNLTVSYCDAEGNPTPPQTIPLDLAVYRDLPIHRESDIDKLTREVKNLADQIGRH